MTRNALLGFCFSMGLVVAGCTPSLAEAPAVTLPPTPITSGSVSTPPTQTCPANELQYLVGKSRAVLQTMRFGSEVRFEEPGQMYTQEFKPNRIRIVIGASGMIDRILCG